MTAPVRPSSLFRDPWLNSNPILLEYLSQAEREKHHAGEKAHLTLDAVLPLGGNRCSAATAAAVSGGSALAPVSEAEGCASSPAGVVSLRRPLVERLRMTAAAMESTAAHNVAELVASRLFDGAEDALDGGEVGEAAEIRELIVAIQDVTAERDELKADLERVRAHTAAAGEAEELSALRRENLALRAENANMFTLKEENETLREQLGTLRLQLECAQGGAEALPARQTRTRSTLPVANAKRYSRPFPF